MCMYIIVLRRSCLWQKPLRMTNTNTQVISEVISVTEYFNDIYFVFFYLSFSLLISGFAVLNPRYLINNILPKKAIPRHKKCLYMYQLCLTCVYHMCYLALD